MLEYFVFPFFVLLLSVAICPVVFNKTWEKIFFPFTIFLSSIIIFLYLFKLNDFVTPLLSFFEYIQFILLIAALYISSGGIKIKINTKGSPLSNVLLLLCGGICANFIGTTGAAMLFIMPFLKINEGRIKPYHIAFFIFIVCNIGGSLSPVGDPPLYLGFLKGVPFSWTLFHNFLPWIFTLAILLLIFYFIDSKNKAKNIYVIENKERLIKINGYKNFIWLILTICSLFINNNIFPFLPCIDFHGHKICFIREILLFIICFCSFKTSDKNILKTNSFSFAPIKELSILFFGIFITMPPVITVIGNLVHGIDKSFINTTFLFWVTGFLSSILDNAPTYLNMLAVSMSSNDFDISKVSDVVSYSSNIIYLKQLRAIAIASIFFGSMTYISNGPNFMIKTIADKNGIKMPSFIGFVVRYSFVFLLPVFVLVWYLFC